MTSANNISKNKSKPIKVPVLISAPYYVYIVECSDKTLYTGSTNNIDKRIMAHNSKKAGAKYTKHRQPVILQYSERCDSRGTALKREYALKQLTRSEKLELIKSAVLS